VVFREDLAGCILSLDGGSAAHYAKLVSARRDAGTPIEAFDALIAGAGLATRDRGGFVGCGGPPRSAIPWRCFETRTPRLM
jgi:predicted nucleic acid-binding protein